MTPSEVLDAPAEAAIAARDVSLSSASSPPTSAELLWAMKCALAAAANNGLTIGGGPGEEG